MVSPNRTETSRVTRRFSLLLLSILLFVTSCQRPRNHIVVASKNFTEQVVLAELMAQHIERRLHVEVERRFYLGGSYIAHQALIAGRIDIYPEYTGTALTAILKLPPQHERTAAYDTVKREYAQRFQIATEKPFGFNNTFAMIIRGEDARNLSISTLSQAATVASQWRVGVGYEFLERPDGYNGLVAAYGLRFKDKPRVMDLGLLYRSLQEHQVDIVAGNSSDGLIAALGCVVLKDDKNYFPPYEAVSLVRQDALARFPGLDAALAELAGKISDDEMRRLNYAIDGEHRDVKTVASEFLNSKGL
jgi:osmoprotectant transport system substrate-binding protein